MHINVADAVNLKKISDESYHLIFGESKHILIYQELLMMLLNQLKNLKMKQIQKVMKKVE